MSCGSGNRFQCGITRFQKHSFTPDKPSNIDLHNENQKRLNELLKSREALDKSFTMISPPSSTSTISSLLSNIDILQIETNLHHLTPSPLTTNTEYTSWTTPSAQYSTK